MSVHTFHCIDGHTCGNPVRLVVKGGPPLEGITMSEKRQHFLKEYDWIRTGLMFEPRGHDMMSGSILYPPSDPENDFGVLFIETSGCLPMCGHGSIGTITMALEEKLVIPKTSGEIRMETPAGLIKASYQMDGKKVAWVRLRNVASFLAAQNLSVECPKLGKLTFDVAYGGNYYAIIDMQHNFSGIQDYTASKLVELSPEIRRRINELYPEMFIHPENKTIRDVSHLLWAGTPLSKKATTRNAVFYGDKAIDRSPCGTGTSARMAQWHAQGKLDVGDPFVHESIIGSQFTGKIEGLIKVGDNEAIIPSIQGWARMYGHNSITIDTDDPFAYGFQVL